MTAVLVFLITVALAAQPQVYNNTSANTTLYNKIVQLVAQDLAINTDSITIYFSTAVFNPKITSEFGVVTDAQQKNCYSINIQDDLFKEDRIRVVLHELVHVSQLYHNRLVIRKTYNWFCGQVVTPEVSFEHRLYEVEACSRTDELYWKYKKELK
jgi:hypothetical protein